MNIEQLLGKLLSEGFVVSIGLHGTGYFAEIHEDNYDGDCRKHVCDQGYGRTSKFK